MLKLLLLAAVIAAASSITCTKCQCAGKGCTPVITGAAATCGAGVEYCLTLDGSKGRESKCDSTNITLRECNGQTEEGCRTIPNGDRGMCTKTTPVNGVIPNGTSCPAQASAAPGTSHRQKCP